MKAEVFRIFRIRVAGKKNGSSLAYDGLMRNDAAMLIKDSDSDA